MPVVVQLKLDELAKPTAVVVHDSLRVAERLQQRIHLWTSKKRVNTSKAWRGSNNNNKLVPCGTDGRLLLNA